MDDTAAGSAPEIAAELAVTLVRDGTPLIDVREPSEWEAGHAPDAHWIPLGELESRLSELPRDTEILVICHSGARSERAARALRDAEFIAVNVAGGMLAWAAAGGEVESGGETSPN
ncbi:MAG: rhodanese-like domain-containing protein [Salinibacterium sp.]|nr:rhodanese-like domain-containing protein [Salinibacterium sp.]